MWRAVRTAYTRNNEGARFIELRTTGPADDVELLRTSCSPARGRVPQIKQVSTREKVYEIETS